ncbi:MAG TPA: hypothetical protein VNN73_20010 [Blastocatellia bacterium]|nr:hypothetical protein [Blastocatellia bacterium]
MDGGVTSALAAIMGAFVGGFASLASTWIGERSRHRRDLLQREIVNRETTYSEFIERASKLYVASATHRIDDDDEEIEGMVSLYAVSSRIRLFASDQVIMEAEKVIEGIVRQYGEDNLSAEQLRMSAVEKRYDPLKTFSVICRRELQDIHNRA